MYNPPLIYGIMHFFLHIYAAPWNIFPTKQKFQNRYPIYYIYAISSTISI